MKISPVNYNNYNFKSSTRNIRMNDYGEVAYSGDDRCTIDFGPIVNSNFTMFFRYDLNRPHSKSINDNGNWDNFTNAIIGEFSNVDKVNVYNFGCSDGSEAYSVALSLIEKMGLEKAGKFFPIRAYDIDDEILAVAKSGRIPCADDDIYRISRNLKSHNTDNLYSLKQNSRNFDYKFHPSSLLKEKVEFEQGDFVEKLFEIEPSNSLVFCRNFWPYLPIESIPFIIQDLSEQIDETSLLVFGAVDIPRVYEPLKRCGFEEIYPFIFKKSSK